MGDVQDNKSNILSCIEEKKMQMEVRAVAEAKDRDLTLGST